MIIMDINFDTDKKNKNKIRIYSQFHNVIFFKKKHQ